MPVVLRACTLSSSAGEYFERYKARELKLAKTEKEKNAVTQKKIVSDMLELLSAFEEHMGVDVETFLISKTKLECQL